MYMMQHVLTSMQVIFPDLHVQIWHSCCHVWPDAKVLLLNTHGCAAGCRPSTSWQCTPARPGGQMHVNSPIPSMHVLPNVHGLDRHSFISERENGHRFLTHNCPTGPVVNALASDHCDRRRHMRWFEVTRSDKWVSPRTAISL